MAARDQARAAPVRKPASIRLAPIADTPRKTPPRTTPPLTTPARRLGNQDVPAFHEEAVATGSCLGADLLAGNVDRGTWAHLDRPLGAVDLNDHCRSEEHTSELQS